MNGKDDLIMSDTIADKVSFDDRTQNVLTVTLDVEQSNKVVSIVGSMRGYRRLKKSVEVELECSLTLAFSVSTSPPSNVKRLALCLGLEDDVDIDITSYTISEILLADVDVDQGTCIFGVKLTTD